MPVEEKKGDMFVVAEQPEYKDYALAHCISEDCKMDKGIAVQFKQRFGCVAELQEQVANGKTTGSALILKKDRPVYYLVTKKVYSDKPTYESLRKSLEDMRMSINAEQAVGVIMPRIGCGLDRLEWPKVHAMLQEVFDDNSGITALVCSI